MICGRRLSASCQQRNEKKLWQFAGKLKKSDTFTKKIRKCLIFHAKSSEEQKKRSSRSQERKKNESGQPATG